jgi:hypothetical protein
MTTQMCKPRPGIETLRRLGRLGVSGHLRRRRGIGEIGLAGFAAAVAAAVHHATSVRVRELPIKIEDLLS